jgi:hypothetical protein
VSKRLPQGLWKDTSLDNKPFRVIYYDSRSRCYRIEYLNMMGMRCWAPVEEFGPDKRFRSMGSWGLLLQATRAARRSRYDKSHHAFELNAADFAL